MKKQQKSKYRFNIIDVLLIVVALAVAAVAYYFISDKASGGGKDNTIRYTVELKDVDKNYIDSILEGDTVIETVRNRTVGKIVDVEVTPAWIITTNIQTGEVSKQFYPAINIPDETVSDLEESSETEETEETVSETNDESVQEEPIYDYYNVRVTIEADAEYTGSRYSIGGYEVVVGERVYFRTPHFTSDGFCVSLETLE